ncbi:MAG: hypothetical protein WDO13_03540 [Verrucomicrobiota bacterium]
MAITTPPPPPKKKSRFGCLGCGCLVLIVILLLIGALIGGAFYAGYKGLYTLTSDTPAAVAPYAGGDDTYNSAEQKIAAFNKTFAAHQPSSVQLTADEINALIAHNPAAIRNNVRAHVTFTGSEAHLETTVPSALLWGLIKGRYFNIDGTFGLGFDAGSHQVRVDPHSLQIGEEALLGPGSANADNPSLNHAFTDSFVPQFNESFNRGLRNNSDAATVLDRATSIEIKDGVLDIETQ